jgi:hypothetical protein
MSQSEFAECDVEIGKCGRNVENLNRIGRLSIGIVIIFAGIYFKSWFGLLGLIPVVVALTGFCPLNRLGRNC